MTRTILKQELSLAGTQTVSLPGEYISLLCVGVQDEKIMLWFETTANLDNLGDAPKKDVSILIVGTGQECSDTIGAVYVGTVQMAYPERVWHVFAFGVGLR